MIRMETILELTAATTNATMADISSAVLRAQNLLKLCSRNGVNSLMEAARVTERMS